MSVISNLTQQLFSGIVPFQLETLKDFPIELWNTQKAYYADLQDVYDGVALEAVVTDKTTGKQIEKFPIKINPLIQTSRKHAATLIGRGIDSIRPDGLPIEFLTDKESDTLGDQLKKFLAKIISDSGLGAIFVSNAIISQYLGGCFFAASWRPADGKVIVHGPLPEEVIAFPNGTDYWNLKEAWLVREITEKDAEFLGYMRSDNKFYYIERWTPKEYKIMVNGNVLIDEDGIPMEGINPFGFVPMVYIPHIREKSFLGKGIISEAVRGIIREINLRWADIGDAVSDEAHAYIAIRNVRTGIKTVTLSDGRQLIDLGSSAGITGENEPDMLAVKAQSTSTPMISLGENLYNFYRREVNHPAVADGEDEGSQRSALTLATRMAPLISEIEMERFFWTIGITQFVRFLIRIGVIKGVENATAEMIEMPLSVKWQPMLPRDREALVEEVSVRAAHQVGSKRHLMELFDDVQDPEEEWTKIQEEEKSLGEIKIPKAPFGGSSNQPVQVGAKNGAIPRKNDQA